MEASVQLLVGGPEIFYVVVFGTVCAIAQVFLSYKRYVAVLKWLSIALFAYVATLFFVKVDLAALIHGLVLPRVSFDSGALSSVVAWLAAAAGGQHRDSAVVHQFWRRWEVNRIFLIR
jgi:hypothetical protein